MSEEAKPHWTAFACEVIALVSISILVGLGKVPSEVLVALVTATISGHSLGGRRPPGPPGAGLIVGTLAATGVGRSVLAVATRLGGAFARQREPAFFAELELRPRPAGFYRNACP